MKKSQVSYLMPQLSGEALFWGGFSTSERGKLGETNGVSDKQIPLCSETAASRGKSADGNRILRRNSGGKSPARIEILIPIDLRSHLSRRNWRNQVSPRQRTI
jgi:hypothetical protein